MIGIPTLFNRNPRNYKVIDEYFPLPTNAFHEWVATELMPGVDVRLTIRNHFCVRLEVINRPTVDQQREDILNPWYRDAGKEGENDKDYWVWKALRNTDLTYVPDGEWSGEAIGYNIKKNPLNLEPNQSKIVLSSLYPWRDHLEGEVLLPPELGRTPFGYKDLQYTLNTTMSKMGNGPLEGIVWWMHDTPVAQIRTKDFPAMVREPSLEAYLPIEGENENISDTL